jgi:hypothetical protein
MGWFYGFMQTQAGCDLMQHPVKGEEFKHGMCCSTPKCNAPDKTLDPTRTIVPAPKRA